MWLTYKEIGHRVKVIRLGLVGSPSRAAFARLLHRSTSYGSVIGRIEQGKEPSWKNGPNEKLLRQIAARGGRTLDHFRASNVVNPDLVEAVTILNWLTETTEELKAQVQRLSGEDALALNVPSAEERRMIEQSLAGHRRDSSNKRRRKEDR